MGNEVNLKLNKNFKNMYHSGAALRKGLEATKAKAWRPVTSS